jgi:DNA-binding winged helix-turn-helix (wHTH) protein
MTEQISKPGKEERIKHLEAEFANHGFRTNDVVRIAGRLQARVNGRYIKVDSHAFALLILLAERATAVPGEYFATEGLINAIMACQARLGKLGLSWVAPDASGIHKAVCRLRAALSKAGLDESLIEHVRVQGYRLSTPAQNVMIDTGFQLTACPG